MKKQTPKQLAATKLAHEDNDLLDRYDDAQLVFSESFAKTFGIRPKIEHGQKDSSQFTVFLAKLGMCRDDIDAARDRYEQKRSNSFLNIAVKQYKERRKINKQAP